MILSNDNDIWCYWCVRMMMRHQAVKKVRLVAEVTSWNSSLVSASRYPLFTLYFVSVNAEKCVRQELSSNLAYRYLVGGVVFFTSWFVCSLVRLFVRYQLVNVLYFEWIDFNANLHKSFRVKIDLADWIFIISPYSVAFGVILSFFFVFFVCTVEDISTQDGAIGVKLWLRVEQTPGTGTR